MKSLLFITVILAFSILSQAALCGEYSDQCSIEGQNIEYSIVVNKFGVPIMLQNINVFYIGNNCENSKLYGTVTRSRLAPIESPPNSYSLDFMGIGIMIYDAKECSKIMTCNTTMTDGKFIDFNLYTCDSKFQNIFKSMTYEDPYVTLESTDNGDILIDGSLYTHAGNDGCSPYFTGIIVLCCLCGVGLIIVAVVLFIVWKNMKAKEVKFIGDQKPIGSKSVHV
ncbi:hypothetical protein WA158_005522 [Blastocystis sp. Blastoise]